jgi:flagellar hook-length control protein FliK
VPVGQGVPAGQEDGEPAPSGEGNADTPASDKVPEHARAGERPGQAKEPGTPAGRPFVTGATPGGVQPAASESAAAAEPQDVAQTATEPPGEEPAPGAHSSRAHARAGAGPSDDLPSLRAAAEPASPAPAEAAPRPDAAARTTSRIAEPAPLRPRVTLAQLAEEVRAIVRLAAGGGLATARISLSPPELGQVEIRLRYRAGGVLAELSAESVQAAQALGQASSDLRRSLEQQGLIVLGLDIRHAGPEARSTAQGRDDESHPGRPQAGDGLADDAAAAEALASLTAEAGVQIDVLA